MFKEDDELTFHRAPVHIRIPKDHTLNIEPVDTASGKGLQYEKVFKGTGSERLTKPKIMIGASVDHLLFERDPGQTHIDTVTGWGREEENPGDLRHPLRIRRSGTIVR